MVLHLVLLIFFLNYSTLQCCCPDKGVAYLRQSLSHWGQQELPDLPIPWWWGFCSDCPGRLGVYSVYLRDGRRLSLLPTKPTRALTKEKWKTKKFARGVVFQPAAPLLGTNPAVLSPLPGSCHTTLAAYFTTVPKLLWNLSCVPLPESEGLTNKVTRESSNTNSNKYKVLYRSTAIKDFVVMPRDIFQDSMTGLWNNIKLLSRPWHTLEKPCKRLRIKEQKINFKWKVFL